MKYKNSILSIGLLITAFSLIATPENDEALRVISVSKEKLKDRTLKDISKIMVEDMSFTRMKNTWEEKGLPQETRRQAFQVIKDFHYRFGAKGAWYGAVEWEDVMKREKEEE